MSIITSVSKFGKEIFGDLTVSGTVEASQDLNASRLGILGSSLENLGNGLFLNGKTHPGHPKYGIFFGDTNIFGNHGNVIGDKATYFTINKESEGWVFKSGTWSSGNVLSISGRGDLTASGSGSFENFSNKKNISSPPNFVSGKNYMSIGPIDLDSEVVVDIPDGVTWVII